MVTVEVILISLCVGMGFSAIAVPSNLLFLNYLREGKGEALKFGLGCAIPQFIWVSIAAISVVKGKLLIESIFIYLELFSIVILTLFIIKLIQSNILSANKNQTPRNKNRSPVAFGFILTVSVPHKIIYYIFALVFFSLVDEKYSLLLNISSVVFVALGAFFYWVIMTLLLENIIHKMSDLVKKCINYFLIGFLIFIVVNILLDFIERAY